MERPLASQKKRADDNWLIGYDSRQFTQLAEQLYLELTQHLLHKGAILLSCATSAISSRFHRGLCSWLSVFLCNPNWVRQEWQQVLELVQPDILGVEVGDFS